eukprot:463676-Rhodomonas_salina.3
MLPQAELAYSIVESENIGNKLSCLLTVLSQLFLLAVLPFARRKLVAINFDSARRNQIQKTAIAVQIVHKF